MLLRSRSLVEPGFYLDQTSVTDFYRHKGLLRVFPQTHEEDHGMAVDHSVDIGRHTVALHLTFIDHVFGRFRRNDHIFPDLSFIDPEPVVDAAEIPDLLRLLQFCHLIAKRSFIRGKIFGILLLDFSVHLQLHVKVVVPGLDEIPGVVGKALACALAETVVDEFEKQFMAATDMSKLLPAAFNAAQEALLQAQIKQRAKKN